MNTLFCRLCAISLLPAVLISLAACDDDDGGGGGGGPALLFFGTNNIHECSPITIDVDLAAANAVVARQGDGSLDCALDTSLAGCNASFDETGGGDNLHVIIDGCEVPPISSLFECNFSDGDISMVAAATSAECDCVGEPACYWNIFCLELPDICVAEEANPSACEDCFNGEDDDGDGFVDCRDRDCAIEDCGFGQTTVTCPNSTSTSTTVSSSTSTTIP
jgi:hypothetical protein